MSAQTIAQFHYHSQVQLNCVLVVSIEKVSLIKSYTQTQRSKGSNYLGLHVAVQIILWVVVVEVVS